MNAAKKSILLLWWLVVASFTTASALTPGATETRVGQKSFAPLESRQAEPLQTAGRHQRNVTCGYELAPESLLAAKTAGNPAGMLAYDAANKTWTSPGGLVYGQGSAQGNRVLHVMDHTVPNPAKPVHSIFSANRNQVIGLVDEAWAARSGPGVLQANGNRVWVVNMGRQVGTGGQTAVQIVVRDGTTEIITAFPK